MSARRALAAAAAVALGLGPLAPVAEASAVTTAQLHGLVARAVTGDGAALARLRGVDRIDGRPADLGGVLRDADPDELRARLRTLGAAAGPAVGDDPGAQSRARAILADGRYRDADLPRPLHGVLRRLGRALDPLRRLVDRVVDRVDDVLPGTRGVAWSALSAVVLVAAFVTTTRLVARRRAVLVDAAAALDPVAGLGPAELERLAADAEGAGQLDRALRLRFRAGLLRLDAAGVIDVRASTSTRDVARRLRSEDFDALARTFDAVAYGGRPAGAGDLAAARTGWATVLARRGAAA